MSRQLREVYRRLIEAVYQRWNPEKLDCLPDVMRKYKDQEPEIYDKVVRKYIFAAGEESWRPLIATFYRHFNPSKIPDLPAILHKYKESEAALYRALCDKYLPTVEVWDDKLLVLVEAAGGLERPPPQPKREALSPAPAPPEPPAIPVPEPMACAGVTPKLSQPPKESVEVAQSQTSNALARADEARAVDGCPTSAAEAGGRNRRKTRRDGAKEQTGRVRLRLRMLPKEEPSDDNRPAVPGVASVAAFGCDGEAYAAHAGHEESKIRQKRRRTRDGEEAPGAGKQTEQLAPAAAAERPSLPRGRAARGTRKKSSGVSKHNGEPVPPSTETLTAAGVVTATGTALGPQARRSEETTGHAQQTPAKAAPGGRRELAEWEKAASREELLRKRLLELKGRIPENGLNAGEPRVPAEGADVATRNERKRLGSSAVLRPASEADLRAKAMRALGMTSANSADAN